MSKRENHPITTLSGSRGMIRVREIISGQYEDFRSPEFLRPHRRDFYSFFIVRQGLIRHSIDFRSYTCEKGQLFFMAPQDVYLIDTAVDFGGISINCRPEVLLPAELNLPIITNPAHNNRLVGDPDTRRELSLQAHRMLQIYQDRGPFAPELLRSGFNMFLLGLSRSYVLENQLPAFSFGQDAIAFRFRFLLDSEWKTLHQVKEYAARLHVSAGHLNALVRSHTGKKAIEHIQEKKLLEARRLLLYSDASIKEIAFDLGFEDPAYFNRFFKKWNGKTPLAFRQEIREKYRIAR